MEHKKGIWRMLSAGGLSGGCWGIIEAVWRLAGSSNGTYDALFWSYCFYVFFGALIGCTLYPLDRILGYKRSESLRWSACFCFVLFGLSMWVTKLWYGMFFLLPCTWMGEIFLRRSPLKILPSMKGTLAMGTVFLLLTFVFSLTTGPISRKLVYPASFSKGKKNVLILSIEGLRGDNMHKEAPNISLVRSRSVRFSHTYSDSLHPQKAMTALLGGQHSWLRESYLSDDFESLAEILLRNGYHTSAVVNELELGIHSGLDQGFERYTYLPSNAPLPFTEGARRVKLIDLLLGFWARLGSDPGRYHRSSVEVLQRVQQDVESFGEENWFVFAQIRELDPPYFLEEHNEFYRAEKGEEEQAYQERLKSLDASFGAFWHWLERRDRNLILVLMSTHPPSYADGPPRFQIPLSIMVPQSHVQEVQHHAQLIDIPPTLAAIIGLPAHHWNGVDLLQENHPREGRPIYSHSPQGWSMVQFDGWRYMLDAQNEEGHLYNIRQDPMLQNNLWHEEPNRRSQLQEVFRTSP